MGAQSDGVAALVDLAGDPRAARTARQAAVRVCEAFHVAAEVVDDVALTASELVTNAVLHGVGALDLTVRVSVAAVRVEVRDRYPRVPYGADPGVGAESGRGLHIVQTLSSRWGAEVQANGKTVWAEFAR